MTVRSALVSFAAPLLAGALFAPAPCAQTLLRTFTPPNPAYPYESFGIALAALGDVDADGIGDYAIGASQDFKNDPGRISIMSGASGAALFNVHGSELGAEFGSGLVPVGDLDGDGVEEVLAAGIAGNSPLTVAHAELRLFSGRTGAALWGLTMTSLTAGGDLRNFYLGGGEDVDGDGIDDYGAAGNWTDTLLTLRIWSGATKQLIREFVVASNAGNIGPFALVGDLDGDARSEIAYAAVSAGNWVVHIASGATSAVLRTCVPSPTLPYGFSSLRIAALGDVDGDGAGDLALGSPTALGSVFVFSGQTGAQIRRHDESEPYASFGWALAGRVDLDHDGVGDLLVGAPYSDAGGINRGVVTAFSGRTGVRLETIAGPQDHARIGISVAGARDANGDGFGDFLIGSPYVGQGRAWLYSPCPLPPRGVGASKVNSLGCTPLMSWNGNPSSANAQAFDVRATQVLNQKTGTLFYGIGDPINVPFQGGVNSVPAPRRRTPYQSSGGSSAGADCSGVFAFDFNARIQSGVDPALVTGARVVVQYWSRDPADPFTTNLTAAVEFVIDP